MPKSLTPMKRSKVAAISANESMTCRIPVAADGGYSTVVTAEVSVECTGQHEVAWDSTVELPYEIAGKPARLPAGKCNLYKYPRVYFRDMRPGKATIPHIEQLYVLDELVKALCIEEDPEGLQKSRQSRSSSSAGALEAARRIGKFAERHDWAGGTPLHGLLVANTPPSLSLALAIYERAPALLQQKHVSAVFQGENALHILCVNSREDELCSCIRLAASRLRPLQLQRIFHSQASGLFFSEEPMALYGSTVVAYAVAFSLQRALTEILLCCRDYEAMKGIIDLNDPKHACKQTGFLPLHVAVANSLTNMFNFLTDLPGLPLEFDDMRARKEILSGLGKNTSLGLQLPLQVAAKLGDKKMVQYILRTQSEQQWEWGPVSEYHLNLNGIDSIGETGNDVMELCARLDASEATKEMLLDEFMNGLMHKLFLQKFNKSLVLHYTMRVIDVIYISTIYTLALWIKQEPDMVMYPNQYHYTNAGQLVVLLPYILLISICPLLEEDWRSAFVWWRIMRSGPSDPEAQKILRERGYVGRVMPWYRDVQKLIAWMNSHAMWRKVFGWAVAAGAALYLISIRRFPPGHNHWSASQVSSRDKTDALLVPLAIGSYIHTQAFFTSFLFQFEKIGVFYKIIFRMLGSDVVPWLALFVVFLINYGSVMYFLYPRFTPDDSIAAAALIADGLEEPAPKFMDFGSALQSLFELAFIGEPLELDILAYTSSGKLISFWKHFLFIWFVIAYANYIVMSLILLLNLLIAMMGDTYQKSMEQATLAWRVDFARRVLRLELQMGIFSRMGLVNLNCGMKVVAPSVNGGKSDVKWVWVYKTYKANAEGGGTRGNSMFQDDIEEEAEEDEADDEGPGGGNASATVTKGSVKRMPSAAAKLNQQKDRAYGKMSASERSEADGYADGEMRKVGMKTVRVKYLAVDAFQKVTSLQPPLQGDSTVVEDMGNAESNAESDYNVING